MKPPVRDNRRPIPPADLKVDAPAAFSLNSFSFNFTVDAAAQVAGRMGAPAFALRRQRVDRKLDDFWADVEVRRDALWIAAREGRIDEQGKEVKPPSWMLQGATSLRILRSASVSFVYAETRTRASGSSSGGLGNATSMTLTSLRLLTRSLSTTSTSPSRPTCRPIPSLDAFSGWARTGCL